jgi:hypothetical protein
MSVRPGCPRRPDGTLEPEDGRNSAALAAEQTAVLVSMQTGRHRRGRRVASDPAAMGRGPLRRRAHGRSADGAAARTRLFVVLAHHAAGHADFLYLPTDRTVVMGAGIDL